MRSRLHMLLAVLALLAGGCSIERGNFDLANPWFDIHCGPVTLIAFRDSTVLHIGTAYLTLSLPFYVPIAFAIFVVAVFWFAAGRRKRG